MFVLFAVCPITGMVLDSNNLCNCPVDTYQDDTSGTTECLACPDTSTTNTQTGVQSIGGCGKSARKINYSCLLNSIHHNQHLHD